MRYKWDEKKREINLEKHGLDFLDAVLVLEAQEKATFPARYEQEEQFKAIAKVEETYFVVIYTMRSDITRIISFRPAKRKERLRYEDVRKYYR